MQNLKSSTNEKMSFMLIPLKLSMVQMLKFAFADIFRLFRPTFFDSFA